MPKLKDLVQEDGPRSGLVFHLWGIWRGPNWKAMEGRANESDSRHNFHSKCQADQEGSFPHHSLKEHLGRNLST